MKRNPIPMTDARPGAMHEYLRACRYMYHLLEREQRLTQHAWFASWQQACVALVEPPTRADASPSPHDPKAADAD